MKQKFPPPRLADLDRRSAAAFMALARAMNRAPVTLFLGSGVSASAGLPVWEELLARICAAFFEHWQLRPFRGTDDPLPPCDLSIAFWEAFEWGSDATRLAAEFAKGNPLLVAQQIKNCIRERDWRYLLNKILYDSESGVHHSALMAALARLCARLRVVAVVVNFNFDSLFEEHLAEEKVKHTVVWSPRVQALRVRLPVLHPHGYLKRGGGPVTPLVLGEADYFEYSCTPYAWPDAVLVGYLSGSTCIFVGHSMTDPNVRRLLRVSSAVSGHRHFALLPRTIDTTERDRMFRALFDRDLGHLGVSAIRYPLRTGQTSPADSHSRLPELVDALRVVGAEPQRMWRSSEDETTG